MTALKKALSIKPQSAEAMNLIGLAMVKSGRFEEARKSFERAILMDQNHMGAYLNLGTWLLRHKNRETAHTFYVRAKKIFPNSQVLSQRIYLTSPAQGSKEKP